MDKGKLKALEMIKKMAMSSLLKKDDDDEDEKDKGLEGVIVEIESEEKPELDLELEEKETSKIKECPHCGKIIHEELEEEDYKDKE